MMLYTICLTFQAPLWAGIVKNLKAAFVTDIITTYVDIARFDYQGNDELDGLDKYADILAN